MERRLYNHMSERVSPSYIFAARFVRKPSLDIYMTLKQLLSVTSGCVLLLIGTSALADGNWAYCYAVHNNASIYQTPVFALPSGTVEKDVPNNYERFLKAKYKPDGVYQIRCHSNTDTSSLEKTKRNIENYAQSNRINATLTSAPVEATSRPASAPVATTGTDQSRPSQATASKPTTSSSQQDYIYCSSFIDRSNPGDPAPEFFVSPLFTVTHNTPGGNWWPSVAGDVKQRWEAAVQRHNPKRGQTQCNHYESHQLASAKDNRDKWIRQMNQPPNGTTPVAVRHLDWTYR